MGNSMALMRGAAVGYDADKMCFRFTMTDGLIAIDCEVSNAALVAPFYVVDTLCWRSVLVRDSYVQDRRTRDARR